MANVVTLPCEDRAELRPGCTGLTTATRTFPDGYTPTEEQLSGYLCDVCAHARAVAAQPPPPMDPPPDPPPG